MPARDSTLTMAHQVRLRPQQLRWLEDRAERGGEGSLSAAIRAAIDEQMREASDDELRLAGGDELVEYARGHDG